MAYIIKDKIQFLAEASKILSSSLDYNVTLTSIANLIVSNIADFCIIDLLKDDGTIERVTVRCADPKKQKIAQKMFHFPPDPKNKEAIYDTAKTGKPILIPHVTEQWLANVSQIPQEREIIKKLGLNSHIFVPLNSRGKVIGVLTFASSNKKFSYTTEDLVLAQELASRAGIAVDNARLFTEAQEAVLARDEFLSIASHELKTPLTSIILHLQAILQNINKQSNNAFGAEKIVKMLKLTEQQSKRLAKLINDLLNVSLITTGKLQFEKELVDLVSIVKNVLTRFDVEIKKTKTHITVKGEKLVVGFWDYVRLEQVISNLISNAIKYGKGKLISIEIQKTDHEAIVKIQDNGIGIDPQNQKEIFKRFKRGVSTKDYQGLGVGLYIAHQIVKAHGGTITLKSQVNKGSTFTLRLPLRETESV